MTPEQQQEAVERVLAKLDEVKAAVVSLEGSLVLMWLLACFTVTIWGLFR